jgi:hypothetical protein
MIRRAVAALAAVSILSGCAHIHQVDPVASESDREDLNRAVRDRLVSVEVPHGVPHRRPVSMRAESVRVGADSTSLTLLLEPGDISALWGEPEYGARRDTTLWTSAITRMTTTNRFRGALDGTLLGLGMGAAFGVVMGLAADDWWPAEARVTVGAIIFGTIGTGAGLVVGAMVGARDTFEFADR